MTSPQTPEGLHYTESHEWIRPDGDELIVGITDHAQAELTDVVYVDLPLVGKKVAAGATVLVLESVKTVADIYAPVAGAVTRGNEELRAHPEWVNQDPYGKGWIYRMKPDGPLDASAFLNAQAYQALLTKTP